MNYYFDTYGIIELINDNFAYQKFKKEIIITSALNVAETHYYLTELLGEKDADYLIKQLNFSLLGLDKDIATEASKLRFKNKKLRMSYADCLGYILARKNNLIFVTGDDAFKNLEGVEFIK